ncbi:GntR family transcriptional regulator [Micromonospora sp. NPDC000207]|uniref:GntR family transcriptional regulator n=1 Tax=Micromonospora sp. NPDC000207 TaxID=3154246 RepID=UPI00331A9D2A
MRLDIVSIDPRSHTPVYVQLAELLRRRVESGDLQPGSLLPSESHLSQEYGIGRDAVRAAIALLRSEGVMTTTKGRGTWVREAPRRTDIELAPGGSTVARMPSSRERREMDLDEGVPVLEIHGPDGDVQIRPADQTRVTRPQSD